MSSYYGSSTQGNISQSENANQALGVVAIGTALANSDPIDYRFSNRGCVSFPAGTSVTSVAWYVCGTLTGTYQKVFDGAGNAVTSTVANNAAGYVIPIPSQVSGAQYLKMLGDAAEAAATVDIKS